MRRKFVVSSLATLLLAVPFVCSSRYPAFSQATPPAGDSGSGGQEGTSSGDMGPTLTISGDPAPPTDVLGEKDGPIDEDGNKTILQEGTTVPVTVQATANGTSAETHEPNTISEVGLFATKVEAGITPDYPHDDSGDAIPHTARVDPNTGVHNCSWTFKWHSISPLNEDALHPQSYSQTWNLHFFYSPGWYWYEGEGEDFWINGGYSFWTHPLGAYHCLADEE